MWKAESVPYSTQYVTHHWAGEIRTASKAHWYSTPVLTAKTSLQICHESWTSTMQHLTRSPCSWTLGSYRRSPPPLLLDTDITVARVPVCLSLDGAICKNTSELIRIFTVCCHQNLCSASRERPGTTKRLFHDLSPSHGTGHIGCWKIAICRVLKSCDVSWMPIAATHPELPENPTPRPC